MKTPSQRFHSALKFHQGKVGSEKRQKTTVGRGQRLTKNKIR